MDLERPRLNSFPSEGFNGELVTDEGVLEMFSRFLVVVARLEKEELVKLADDGLLLQCKGDPKERGMREEAQRVVVVGHSLVCGEMLLKEMQVRVSYGPQFRK